MTGVDEGIVTKRIIGEYSRGEQGPLVVCTGGFHGNEQAGVLALQRVFSMLEASEIDMKGSLIGLAANLAALEQHSRFIDKDMNRIWHSDIIERVKGTDASSLVVHEEREMKELLALMEGYFSAGNDQCLYLDLHTTSAEGGVFTIPTDDPRSERVALELHVPLIVGLEEVVFGTALHYFHLKGIPAVAFEAGQHDDQDSVENIVEAILLLLAHIGCIEMDDLPTLPNYQKRLEKLAHGLPSKVRFCYRHDVNDGDGFKMEPGFENFMEVEKGQLLATDASGELRAQVSGKILMPLYQDKGEDGFFIVQEI